MSRHTEDKRYIILEKDTCSNKHGVCPMRLYKVGPGPSY